MTILRDLLKHTGAFALVAALLPSLAGPAFARDSYVQDGAGMFKASTVSTLNQNIGDFNRQTGKEIVVVTVSSLDGASAPDAAEKVFAQQQVNGVLIFLSKSDKKDGIIGDKASEAFFPSGSFDSIRQAMRGYFRDGDFDSGITTGVGLFLNEYRSHERSIGTNHSQSYAPSSSQQSMGGGGMSLFWLILILIAGFLIIRAVFRAFTGGVRGRNAPPGYGGGPGPGYGGPGYGGGGYGYGGGGGGGGSFFSGLLGGLGGAFLGNELFGHQNYGGGNIGNANIGDMSGQQGGGDSGGWQSDPGQADTSNSSFGDFGSSGGGFGDGGGGDGGGGGDSGGW